jgi:hypothetical protein
VEWPENDKPVRNAIFMTKECLNIDAGSKIYNFDWVKAIGKIYLAGAREGKAGAISLEVFS